MIDLFLTKILNLTETELKELIYEGEAGKETLKTDAGDILINTYAERVAKKNKASEQVKFDQGFQKAHKEISDKYKKAIKEKLNYESDKEDIEELFTDLSETIKTKSKSTLTDDQIKASEIFIKREKELNEAINKLKTDFETEKNGIITGYQKQQNLIKVKEKAEQLLLTSGAVLSEDPTRRRNQINMFLNDFNEYDYEFKDNDLIVLKNGVRVEDKLNNPVKIDDLIIENAKNVFDFKVQDDKGGAGNRGAGGGLSIVIKDQADYMQQYDNAKDLPTKMAIKSAWDSMQK